MKPLFYGTVDQFGKLDLDDRVGIRKYLMHFKESAVQVSIEKRKRPRSNEQNRYYWAVPVAILAEHTGYTPEEMHDALRIKFLGEGREDLPTVKSTTGLSTDEFEDYQTNIKQWAATELSIYIPDPNEVEY